MNSLPTRLPIPKGLGSVSQEPRVPSVPDSSGFTAPEEMLATVRERLAEIAQDEAERIVAVYREAMEALDGGGNPDHRRRVRAATAFLARRSAGNPFRFRGREADRSEHHHHATDIEPLEGELGGPAAGVEAAPPALSGGRVSKLSLTELRSADGGRGDTSHVVSPPLAGASRGV
jgi:hypothetical protein